MSQKENEIRVPTRWSLPRISILLGVVSIACALGIGVTAYRRSLAVSEAHHQDLYLTKARILAAAAKTGDDIPDDELLQIIDRRWTDFGVKPADEYLRIVDKDFKIIFHSSDPDLLDSRVTEDLVVETAERPAFLLRNLIEKQPEYLGVGHCKSKKGGEEVVALVGIPQRKWLLSVHRCRKVLAREAGVGFLGLVGGFIVVCGLLMPLSFGLLYCTFWWAHRRRQRAEEELIESNTQLTRSEQDLRVANVQLADSLEKLKRAQQQMIHQERVKAVGQMASGIAHDFGNALMPVVGLTRMLLKNPGILDDREKTLDVLRTLVDGATDARAVVGRLREFYKPEAESRYGPVDVNKVVQSTVLVTQPKWQAETRAEGRAVEIETDLQEVGPSVGSEQQLRSALTNLIINSLDAMPEGGTITIRTSGDEERTTITFSDTGTGMSQEACDRCFEAFFTTKGDEGGTGLGLVTTREIIERHDGTIEVQTALGKGSTFTIRLPVREYVPPEKETAPETEPIPPMRVLVVDDHVGSQQMLKRYLIHDDHTVETEDTGTGAVNRLKNESFDLVITDRALPGVSGDMVAIAAKSSSPETPVIMLTGFGESMIEQKNYPAGVDLILPKPVGPEELRDAVAEVIGRQ